MKLFTSADYASARAYDLLEAAGRGHIAFDRRLFRALTADPERTRPDLVRFAGEDRTKDRVPMYLPLMNLFTAMPAPEAVGLVVRELREYPGDVSMAALELAVVLGPDATDALLDLFEQEPQETEPLFVALTAGAAGPRVEELLRRVEQADPAEAAFLREIRDNRYERSPLEDLIEWMPEDGEPDLAGLPEEELALFLTSADPELRRLGAEASGADGGGPMPDRRRQLLLGLGAGDANEEVRAAAWEALTEEADIKAVREAMLARLPQAAGFPDERAALVAALAAEGAAPGLEAAIEQLYGDPRTRHKAIEAMWRSLDRRWIEVPPRHLADEDVEVQRQAIVAAGYFQLRSEAGRLADLMLNADVRMEALAAYAMAAPAQESRYGMHELEKRIEDLAMGLSDEELDEVRESLEFRLAMAGKFGATHGSNVGADTVVLGAKTGRNDPCPCGSGKKYKKCHGA